MSETASEGLVVEHVAKSYPIAGGELVILRNVNLALARGEALAILGPSGSGKSTLLHLLAGLDRPTGGSIRVHGINPHQLEERGLADYRNRKVGLVFQAHHLLPQCSVLENVLIPALAADGITPALAERGRALLDRVGMSHRVLHRPAELSGGERQRVALARALLLQPALLLCDEPTGNLDRKAAAIVADLLVELQRDHGVTLVLVTHSDQLAARLPRRVELSDGELLPVA